ncbi:[protein-PII] uridylyltransferase family protein [Neorhodopirellula lusitana]|uniref:[protein-PII] uridylyltransferase family protein n=1 Tax=Neorhodopirellula lusitana TaxID=445327 RepID=UPI00384CA102
MNASGTLPPWQTFEPLRAERFTDADRVRKALYQIAISGASQDLLMSLWVALDQAISQVDDADPTLESFARFVDVSRSPTSLLALFERDPQALPALLQVLSTSEAIADLLIRDPESFDLIRASDGEPSPPEVLVDELSAELSTVGTIARAAVAIRRFAGREILRVAYGEFAKGLPPDRVGRQISHVTDAIFQASLNFVIEQVATRHPVPQRIDGTQPTYAIIGLGNYGGLEIGYDSPLDLLLLCDQIDRKNESHLRFNRAVVSSLIGLLGADRDPVVSMNLRFIAQPGEDAGWSDTQRLSDLLRDGNSRERRVDFHDAEEAAAHYERENETWQRLSFVKARVVAGDQKMGRGFLKRIEPWVYHQLLTRGEIADIRVLRRKLEKRALSSDSQTGTPIADCPGGRRDIELTIQFLQLLHGAELPEVRVPGTLDAIAALGRHGCLTVQEASILSENHARLCRLEHHLAVLFDHRVTHLPADEALRARLAWRLGVRSGTTGKQDREHGDVERFEKLLNETLEVDRKIINHLMVQEATSSPVSGTGAGVNELMPVQDGVAIETELILDPDPDMDAYRQVILGHGFEHVDRAIDHLSSLSHETVSFLSPRRCRHFFAKVAPNLLREVSLMPAPDLTLGRLVEVADSIGAKATLWELLGSNQATLSLMVKLCSLAPYLTDILKSNPGMIDELIDSLVINRLPSAERLDVQSIRLCSSADDLELILHAFKAGSHLMVGARDLLNKESFDAIGRALSDTAEACLRRVIEDEQEQLAIRFGDPVDKLGDPSELVAIALGKFGGRETNYHSDLDLTFIYTADGETTRRVGGPRTTLSNRQFFNQLVQNVIHRIDSEKGRLYEVNLPFSRGVDETVFTESLRHFAKPFRHGVCPLWQRLALCQARPVSGSSDAMEQVRKVIEKGLSQVHWREIDGKEVMAIRQRSESTATPNNIKRGTGGTADVLALFAAGKLRYSTNESSITATGVIDGLGELAEHGVYDASDTAKLIEHYRYLRNIETKLRLINTPSRDELPVSVDGERVTLEMQQLACLLDCSDVSEILSECSQVRSEVRAIFNRLLST